MGLETEMSASNSQKAKARVMRRYPTARAVKSKNGWCVHRIPKGRGLCIPLDDCWMRLESQAWIRAEWRMQ